VRYLYAAMILGIVVLWHERLPWVALGVFMTLCVLIWLRGIVLRRHFETWMDDLARATLRLLSPSGRVTTRWPGSADTPTAEPLPLYVDEPASDPILHLRRPREGIREAFKPDKTPDTNP
jgi:hypothetical protein